MKDKLRVVWRYDEGLDVSHLDQWNTPEKYYDVEAVCEACGESLKYIGRHVFSCENSDCENSRDLLKVGEELTAGSNAGMMIEGGVSVPYEAYAAKWGNPNRYVGLLALVERRCAYCESWVETGEYLGNVNVLDTDAYFTGDILQSELESGLKALEPWQRDMTLDLLHEAQLALKEKTDG